MGRTSREIQLVEYPEGDVHASHFRSVAAQVPEPGPGEVLVRNTFTSVDPGMRRSGDLFQAVSNDLTLRGGRGSSYLHRLPDVTREIGGWLADGRLQYRETIVEGLERAPEALVRTLSGDTTGKTLVRIA